MLLLDQQPGPSAYFEHRAAAWFLKTPIRISGQPKDLPLGFVDVEYHSGPVPSWVNHTPELPTQATAVCWTQAERRLGVQGLTVCGTPVYDYGECRADTYNKWFERVGQTHTRPEHVIRALQG